MYSNVPYLILKEGTLMGNFPPPLLHIDATLKHHQHYYSIIVYS
jgi:hypothetical protein